MSSAIKRLLDVAVASTAMIVAGPLLIALATAVRLDSPGPALFVQTRIGRHGRPIRVAKLRTMSDGKAPGPEITSSGDPRITRLGGLLRKTKLDELPQLWHVLMGDMSIVGPRPEVPRYVDAYRPEWRPLLTVRPGLTDIASLVFRDEERLLATAADPERAYVEVVMPIKLALALEGVHRSSARHDLRVIVRTFLAIIGMRDDRSRAIVAEAMQRIANLEGIAS